MAEMSISVQLQFYLAFDQQTSLIQGYRLYSISIKIQYSQR